MQTTRVLLGLLTAAALFTERAEAQTPSKEFGIDLAIQSQKVDEADNSILQVGTPVDIRIGFLISPRMSFEPRFGLQYLSSDGDSFLSFTPSLNILMNLAGTNHMSPYVTAGVLMDLEQVDFLGESDTQTQLGFQAGIGTRLEWGNNAAFRPELFFTKRMEKGDVFDIDYVPGSTIFGVRLGISFFH